MKPVEFPQQTVVLAKDQPQYEPFPVHFDENTGGCIGCFELTDEERAAIAAGGKLWLWQFTFGRPFQPVSLTTENPWPAAPLATQKASDPVEVQTEPHLITETYNQASPGVIQAATEVCCYDWSDNDDDASSSVERLRVALAAAPKPPAPLDSEPAGFASKEGSIVKLSDPAPPVASDPPIVAWTDGASSWLAPRADLSGINALVLADDHARIVKHHMAGAIEIQLLLDAKTLECESAQDALRDALVDIVANYDHARIVAEKDAEIEAWRSKVEPLLGERWAYKQRAEALAGLLREATETIEEAAQAIATNLGVKLPKVAAPGSLKVRIDTMLAERDGVAK